MPLAPCPCCPADAVNVALWLVGQVEVDDVGKRRPHQLPRGRHVGRHKGHGFHRPERRFRAFWRWFWLLLP